MGRVAVLFLLAGGAWAQTPDGTLAPPARWTGPGGAASGSRSSSALPVMGEIEEAWSLRPEDCERIETPPCLWDGRGFFLASGSKGRFIFCFDVRSGGVITRKKILAYSKLRDLPGKPALHVWDRWLYVEQRGLPLYGYVWSDRSIRQSWRPRDLEGSHNLTVFENEVYVPSVGFPVQCYKPGRGSAEWGAWGADSSFERQRGVGISTEVQYYAGSRPAVYGPYVFVLVGFSKRITASNVRSRLTMHNYGVYIRAYRRSNGRMVASKLIAEYEGKATTPRTPGSLVVTDSTIYAESPWALETLRKGKIKRPDLILSWRPRGDVIVLGEPRVWKFLLPPAHHASGTIALLRDPDLTWALLVGDKWAKLARSRQQPELFDSLVPPTVVGDVVYFGNFAVDLPTREILWKLPVKKVSFAAVPTDGLVLVVDEGGVLRAFRERRDR